MFGWFDRFIGSYKGGVPLEDDNHRIDDYEHPAEDANDPLRTNQGGAAGGQPQPDGNNQVHHILNHPTELPYTAEVNKAMRDLVESLDSLPPEDALADEPRGLLVDLLDHQSYGLEWLSWRERQHPQGGILADEMGLGKTVMLLSLILRSKAEFAASKRLSKSYPTALPPFDNDASKTTLIIVPPGLLQQWEDEIVGKTPSLSYTVYHGPEREESVKALTKCDVVLSTFQTVTNDITSQPPTCDQSITKTKTPSVLSKIKFRRIILDEGHYIRNHKSKTAGAMRKLDAAFRWVASGTPIHNRPSDLYSLVSFLGFEPFNVSTVWNNFIGLKQIKTKENSDRFVTLGRALILCRTKEHEKESTNIPAKHSNDVIVTLSPEEREVYNQLFTTARVVFKKFMQNQENPNQNAPDSSITFTQVLVLLLRLRQLVVLPHLIKGKCDLEDIDGQDDEDQEDSDEDDEKYEQLPRVPSELNEDDPVFEGMFESAKIKQLLADLRNLKVTTRNRRNMEKAIIVSQWTSLLDIVALHLDEEDYHYEIIAGNVPLDERAEIQTEFNQKGRGPQILLLSLCAGGVGLNLTGANHMYFMDVHWNPQLEAQAQSRIHRFGQTKECHITRYIAEGTIEQRVIDLQEEKLKLSKGLLTRTNKLGTKLDIATMKQLFN